GFSPKGLLLQAVATSIDACAVGASLAMSGRKILLAATLMGVVTALASIGGVKLGAKFGHFFNERKIVIAGGLVLVGIGVKILAEHLCK
ncbi:MAG: manganese efflux pump, partial [Victivallaceae bacterium]